MMKAKEARELSSCHPKLNGTLNELLEDIENYIKKECNCRETGLYYAVDSFKYSYDTTKKAIKVLKKNKYKVKKMVETPFLPNRPKKITLKVLWWY